MRTYLTEKFNDTPFPHVTFSNLLSPESLDILLDIGDGLTPSCSFNGSRGDVKNRCHLHQNNLQHKLVGDEIKFRVLPWIRGWREKICSDNDMNSRDRKLRLELCCDSDSFWQIPHLDTQDKLCTCLVYLRGTEDLGTDLCADQDTLVSRAPFGKNKGLLFFPSNSSWHGFAKRSEPFSDRLTLIINEVVNWSDTHELY